MRWKERFLYSMEGVNRSTPKKKKKVALSSFFGKKMKKEKKKTYDPKKTGLSLMWRLKFCLIPAKADFSFPLVVR